MLANKMILKMIYCLRRERRVSMIFFEKKPTKKRKLRSNGNTIKIPF